MLSDLFKATQPGDGQDRIWVCSAFYTQHNPAAYSENKKDRGSL